MSKNAKAERRSGERKPRNALDEAELRALAALNGNNATDAALFAGRVRTVVQRFAHKRPSDLIGPAPTMEWIFGGEVRAKKKAEGGRYGMSALTELLQAMSPEECDQLGRHLFAAANVHVKEGQRPGVALMAFFAAASAVLKDTSGFMSGLFSSDRDLQQWGKLAGIAHAFHDFHVPIATGSNSNFIRVCAAAGVGRHFVKDNLPRVMPEVERFDGSSFVV